MTRITAEDLAAHTCEHQLALFRAVFPNGAPVTVEAAAQARAAGLNVQSAARRLLARDVWHRYNTLTAPIWARHRSEVVALRARYDAEAAAIQDDSEIAALWDRYEAEAAILLDNRDTEADAVLVQLLNSGV